MMIIELYTHPLPMAKDLSLMLPSVNHFRIWYTEINFQHNLLDTFHRLACKNKFVCLFLIYY